MCYSPLPQAIFITGAEVARANGVYVQVGEMYHGSFTRRELGPKHLRNTAPLYKHLSMDAWVYRGWLPLSCTEVGGVGWILSLKDPRSYRGWSDGWKTNQAIICFQDCASLSVPCGSWKTASESPKTSLQS